MSNRTATKRRASVERRIVSRLLAEEVGRRELKEGDIVEVTHFFPNSEPVTYRAQIHFDADGRCELEPVKLDTSNRLRLQQTFYATYPIEGFSDWFMISAAPVNLSLAARIRFAIYSRIFN